MRAAPRLPAGPWPRSVSMPQRFWYSTSHFTLPVAMRGMSGGILVKRISQMGKRREALVAQHADVELAPLDVLLGDGVRLDLVVDELHALVELLVVASRATPARCRASPPR